MGMECLRLFQSARMDLSITDHLKQNLSSTKNVKVEYSADEFDEEETTFIYPESNVKLDQSQCYETDPLIDVEFDKDCEENKSVIDMNVGLERDDDYLNTADKQLSPEISSKVSTLNSSSTDTHKRMIQVDNEEKVIMVQMMRAEVLKEFNLRALNQSYICATYKCELCLKTFPIEKSLTLHMRQHKEEHGKYECFYCKIRFKNYNKWYSHQVRHGVRFKCSHCDFFKFRKTEVVDHFTDVHEKVDLEDCQICDKKFKTSGSKRKHLCKKPTVKCDICGKLITKYALESHIGRFHSEKQFTCQDCGKKYASEKLLLMHNNQVHTYESFYCVECDVIFKSKIAYDKHLSNTSKHMKPEDLKLCPYCPLQVPYWRMKYHLNIVHLKAKPYKCDICVKAFCVKSHLIAHIRRTHDKAIKGKPFICEICGKVLQSKATMKMHINTHTGARPFKCHLCPSKFGHSASLFTHNKLVHLKQKRKLKTKNKSTPVEEEC